MSNEVVEKILELYAKACDAHPFNKYPWPYFFFWPEKFDEICLSVGAEWWDVDTARREAKSLYPEAKIFGYAKGEMGKGTRGGERVIRSTKPFS